MIFNKTKNHILCIVLYHRYISCVNTHTHTHSPIHICTDENNVYSATDGFKTGPGRTESDKFSIEFSVSSSKID